MNIEKLARHLKEFTLDEIEMIAECDCKTELEHLLNEGKIVFEQNSYKYVEVSKGRLLNCTQNRLLEKRISFYLEIWHKIIF